MARYPVQGEQSVEIPDAPPAPSGPVGIGFLWNQIYCDPVGKVWTCPPGKTNFGVRVQPIISGDRPVKFLTHLRLLVDNLDGDHELRFAYVLGTTSSVPGGKPLYPYLGVAHGRGGNDYGGSDPDCIETLAAHNASMEEDFRLDVCDNILMSEQPIPNWPNWKMEQQNGKYPAIAPVFYNYSNFTVKVRTMMVVGVAYY